MDSFFLQVFLLSFDIHPHTEFCKNFAISLLPSQHLPVQSQQYKKPEKEHT